MWDILKWLGLAPAADGVISNLTDIEFMKKFDLLHGFLGVTPHIAGAVLFFVARHIAALTNAHVPRPRADSRRYRAGIFALVLFLLCVVIALIPFPEDMAKALVEVRWGGAALFYIAFYISLGLSEPSAP